jgi:beta-glucuronidase
MYDLVKKLDPDRYVSYADDHIINGTDPKTNAASLADFVMMNEYAGTWHGDAAKLAPALERAGREYPDKMIIISEFGVAGIFAKDKVEGDALRRKIIREQLELFQKYDYIGGALLWCYQDYRSHRNLRPGETAGYVEMGVVDENRQRYPSFDLWKELNAPAEAEIGFKFPGPWQAPNGFRALIERKPESAIPSYPLHGYTARWTVRDEANRLIANGEETIELIGAAHSMAGAFQAPKATALHLKFELVRPTGYVAFERTVDWSSGLSGGDGVADMEKRGIKIP